MQYLSLEDKSFSYFFLNYHIFVIIIENKTLFVYIELVLKKRKNTSHTNDLYLSIDKWRLCSFSKESIILTWLKYNIYELQGNCLNNVSYE